MTSRSTSSCNFFNNALPSIKWNPAHWLNDWSDIWINFESELLLLKSDACACDTTKNEAVTTHAVLGTWTISIHLPKSERDCLLAYGYNFAAAG